MTPIIKPINPDGGGYVVLSLGQFNDLREDSGQPALTENQFALIGQGLGDGLRMLEIPSNKSLKEDNNG